MAAEGSGVQGHCGRGVEVEACGLWCLVGTFVCFACGVCVVGTELVIKRLVT